MLNLTNLSYLNSLLLANIRSSYIKDSLNLYLIEPMGIIGSLLNLISLAILSKKTFQNRNIFKLMKIYNQISLGITFIVCFIFLFTPAVLFELSKSTIGRVYICNVMVWFYLFLFFFGNCLDILMNLERALNYSNGYQRIKQISPYWISFIVFIICLIIHMPIDLAQTFTPDDQLYTKLRLCYLTSFAIQPVTKMILLVSFIIEGPIVMILAIISNLLAYASYKAFMKRKSMTTITVNRQQTVELTKIEKRRQAKKEKMNQRLLKMTIYLTIFSIISHLIQFAAQSIIFLFSSYVSVTIFLWAQFAYIFIIVLKHFSTIFFFYYFNINFKEALNCWSKKRPIPTNINNNNN